MLYGEALLSLLQKLTQKTVRKTSTHHRDDAS
jgi:hypothetical protein